MIRSLRARLRATPYSREVWLLCAVAALGSGSYLGMQQLLHSLYVLRLGYGADTVGMLSATGALSFSAACLLGGVLGVRLGSHRTTILGASICTLGMAMPPVAGLLADGWRLAWLVAGQIVISIGWSMETVSLIASMAVATDVRERNGAFALRETFASVGMLIGALIGGLLPGIVADLMGTTTAEPLPYALALCFTVVGCGMTLVPLMMSRKAMQAAERAQAHEMAPRPGADPDTAPTHFRLEPVLLVLLACGFATNAGHSACKTFAAVYMDTVYRLPTSLIGTITSVGMGVTAVTALTSTRLARRRNSGQLMLLGAVGMCAALLVMALVQSPVGPVIGVVGVYGILGLWRPAYQSLQMSMAHPRYRSLVAGASSMGMSLGFGAMGIVGGHVATTTGYPTVFMMGAGVALVSAFLAGTLSRRTAG